jgi:hypothetical protein
LSILSCHLDMINLGDQDIEIYTIFGGDERPSIPRFTSYFGVQRVPWVLRGPDGSAGDFDAHSIASIAWGFATLVAWTNAGCDAARCWVE